MRSSVREMWCYVRETGVSVREMRGSVHEMRSSVCEMWCCVHEMGTSVREMQYTVVQLNFS